MTDEPIEPISLPRPGKRPGSGHAAALTMAGGASTGSPFVASPFEPRRFAAPPLESAPSFPSPTWSISPEIQAIPARTPGFAPPQRAVSAEQAALRPAAGFEPSQQAPPPVSVAVPGQVTVPVYQEPPIHGAPWQGPAESGLMESGPEFSRRRNNLVIGASAAAAVAVAIGAISLTRNSAPPTSAATSSGEKVNAAFGPGAGDPTEDPHANGLALNAASGSAFGSQESAGDQASNTGAASPPPVVTPPPNPNPVTAKPPPKPTATCTGWHTTHVPAQDGKGTITGASALRAGPYATCATVGATFSSGQHMYVWCHAVNAFGATWVYGRMDSTGAPGWEAVTALKAGAKLGPVC